MDHVDTFSLSLGALVAFTLALLVLSVVLLVVFRAGVAFLQRFQSIGAERVNGRVQVRGLFEESREPERIEEVTMQNAEIHVSDDAQAERIAKAFSRDVKRAAEIRVKPTGDLS
jgi:hypothetical protein